MPEFHTTLGCANALEQLIIEAREQLLLVSPYVKIPQTLQERLREAANRGVAITIVYGKDSMREEQHAQLRRFEGLRLLFLQNLHAKCYASEQGMLITSMNFYEYSMHHNREMGLYIAATEPAYAKAWGELQSILEMANLESLSGGTATPFPWKSRASTLFAKSQTYKAKAVAGSCIRCRSEIPLNSDRPFCVDCFTSWNAYGNDEYPERYCHRCGAPRDTCMARPLCIQCYRCS